MKTGKPNQIITALLETVLLLFLNGVQIFADGDDVAIVLVSTSEADSVGTFVLVHDQAFQFGGREVGHQPAVDEGGRDHVLAVAWGLDGLDDGEVSAPQVAAAICVPALLAEAELSNHSVHRLQGSHPKGQERPVTEPWGQDAWCFVLRKKDKILFKNGWTLEIRGRFGRACEKLSLR